MQEASKDEPKGLLDLERQKEVARNLGLTMIYSLNALIGHRTETSFLLEKERCLKLHCHEKGSGKRVSWWL